MIATGGLLRMNRRQDSLRSKNRAENKRKRKSKKKKKNDVVIVKGKLNLCSPAGLVAAIGVIILMVGISMAVLGYWPSQNQHKYQERRRNGAFHNSRMSYSRSPSASPNLTHDKSPSSPTNEFNQSHSNSSATEPSSHCGILCDFLDNYLYSDNLKVFGPLVMGIGIFLFICANAVLHENRDKKTKIINLRDIYSTVIDLHSMRSKEYSPLNGLVNYTQSRSVESFTDTVYSIYKNYSNSGEQAPQPRQWETTSIVTSSVNAFTLPVIKLNNCEVEESERAEAEGRSEEEVVIEAAAENISEEGHASSGHTIEIDGKHKGSATMMDSPPPHLSQEDRTTETVHPQEVPHTQLFPPGPVATAMGSNVSLNSFTDQPRLARRCSLSVSGSRQGDRARRFSCPRLERSNSKGYIKLTDLGGESFEAPDTHTSLVATGQEAEMDATAAREEEAQGEDALVTPSTSTES
uniref:Transmembrane protein 200C n=1 Tax=Kryptolebias marmoratus TaxID=37003 RepID=A0A3Q3BD42_KRYMA